MPEGKIKCKICGNQFRKTGLHLHMEWAHGVIFEEKPKFHFNDSEYMETGE